MTQVAYLTIKLGDDKMEEVKRFKCLGCGEIYLTAEKALECMGKHVAISNIESCEYLEPETGDTTYAERIRIKYTNGRVIQYERTNTGDKNFNG